MKTKKYKLNLSKYEIETPQGIVEFPLREVFSNWLRTVGMFKTAEDVAEAVCLAKQIRDCTADVIVLDEKEATIIKRVVDRLLELTADGRTNVGGLRHEEAICRVASMKKIGD